jgi:hypothetical protein
MTKWIFWVSTIALMGLCSVGMAKGRDDPPPEPRPTCVEWAPPTCARWCKDIKNEVFCCAYNPPTKCLRWSNQCVDPMYGMTSVDEYVPLQREGRTCLEWCKSVCQHWCKDIKGVVFCCAYNPPECCRWG